jgi:hypothetical protein
MNNQLTRAVVVVVVTIVQHINVVFHSTTSFNACDSEKAQPI